MVKWKSILKSPTVEDLEKIRLHVKRAFIKAAEEQAVIEDLMGERDGR